VSVIQFLKETEMLMVSDESSETTLVCSIQCHCQ